MLSQFLNSLTELLLGTFFIIELSDPVIGQDIAKDIHECLDSLQHDVKVVVRAQLQEILDFVVAVGWERNDACLELFDHLQFLGEGKFLHHIVVEGLLILRLSRLQNSFLLQLLHFFLSAWHQVLRAASLLEQSLVLGLSQTLLTLRFDISSAFFLGLTLGMLIRRVHFISFLQY